MLVTYKYHKLLYFITLHAREVTHRIFRVKIINGILKFIDLNLQNVNFYPKGKINNKYKNISSIE